MPVRIDRAAGDISAASTRAVRLPASRPGDLLIGLGRMGASLAGEELAEYQRENAVTEEKAKRLELSKAVSDARLALSTQLNDDLSSYDGSLPGFDEALQRQLGQDLTNRITAAPDYLKIDLEQALLPLKERLTLAIREGASGKRQSYVMNGLSGQLNTLALSVQNDPMSLPDALSDLNDLSLAAPEPLQQGFTDEGRQIIVNSYIGARIENDPEGLLGELDEGRLDAFLTPELKRKYKNVASGEVQRSILLEKKKIEEQQKEADAMTKELVARVKAYYSAGLAPPPELLNETLKHIASVGDEAALEGVSLAEYKARSKNSEVRVTDVRRSLRVLDETVGRGLSPTSSVIAEARKGVEALGRKDLEAEFNQIVQHSELRQELVFAPVSDLQNRLNDIRKGQVDADGLERYKVISGLLQARLKHEDDPLAWAEGNGVPITPIDLKSETLIGDVAERVVQALTVSDDMGEPVKLFKKVERKALLKEFDDMQPDEQLVMLSKLVSGAGGASGSMMSELSGEDGSFAQAGYLLSSDRQDLAYQILKGRHAIKSDKTLLGKDSVYSDVEEELLHDAIPDEARRKSLIHAARHLYASQLAARGDTIEDFEERDYKAAVQMAAGQSGNTGGIGRVRGSNIYLPPRMSRSDVINILDTMNLSDWKAFSLSGQDVPAIIGNDKTPRPMTEAELKKVRLYSVGEGKYQLRTISPGLGWGAVLTLDQDDGEVRSFVLDLSSVNPVAVKTRKWLEQSQKQRGK